MSIIIMLLLLSVLILVHEFGHFIAAKAFKMKVEKFGFGLPIGPTLYEKKFGDTTFLIHAFLLGGYIAFPDDEKDCELDKDSDERFINRPIYQRAIVISAGVFANVVCAFVFVLMVAILWGKIPSGMSEVFINDIVASKDQLIWTSGAQKGDKIVQANGSDIINPSALLTIITQSKDSDGKVSPASVQNNLDELRRINIGFKKDEIISKDVLVKLPSVMPESQITLNDKVEKGFKRYEDKDSIVLNEKATQLRDTIRKTGKNYYISDGNNSLNDIALALSDGVHPVNIKVERNGKIIDLKTIYPNKNGQIGVKLETKEILMPTKTIPSALYYSSRYLWDNTYMMIYGLYQIFSGKIPLQDLHGIVAITKVGGDIIANNGMFQGLLLIAIISMDLALVNFLPIPALDGGHLFFLFIEKIHGRRLNDKIIEKIGTIGFTFLIILMIFVIFNDVFALLTNKF